MADHPLYAAKKSGRNRSVGLSATSTTRANEHHQEIGSNLQGMIHNQELHVIAQNADVLVWD